MTTNDDVILDANTGISLEEQQEILSRINGIAEKNRRSLSQSQANAKVTIDAKKSGALFPILVNIAAVVILFGGGLFLVSFNSRKDAQVREGNAVFNLTERALIDEIRKDTASKLASKENEIETIGSRLEEVDVLLRQMLSGSQELTQEQLASQARLQALQNAYLLELASLQDERSQILEESRLREASLRTQLEERVAAQQRSSIELDAAMGDLERMSGDQRKAAAIDAQLAGGLAVINDMIRLNQAEQAFAAIKELRSFLESESLQSNRSFQPRRDFYIQAVYSMEMMIDDIIRTSGGFTAPAVDENEFAELQAKNAQLEETIADMQTTLTSLNSGSSGQARRLTQLENTVSSLRNTNSTLESSAAEKDRTINSLESEKADLAQTITMREAAIGELRAANSTQEQEIANLRNQIAVIRQALQE